jgi:hypothetical protein
MIPLRGFGHQPITTAPIVFDWSIASRPARYCHDGRLVGGRFVAPGFAGIGRVRVCLADETTLNQNM